MKWENRRSSSNVEDRRGYGGRSRGGGRRRAPIFRGVRLPVGAVIILLLAYLIFGGGFKALPYILMGLSGGGYSDNIIADEDFQNSEDIKRFSGVVLADTEDV